MRTQVLSALLVGMLAGPHAIVAAADLAGGKDHPLISRYAGATLNAFAQEEYAEIEIIQSAKLPPADSGRRFGEQKAGGKLTASNYLAPAKRTPLEVFRNYEQALKQGGFELLYSCETSNCEKRKITGQNRYAQDLLARRLNDLWSEKAPSVEWTDNPSYFVSARLKRPAGDVYAAIFVTPGYAGAEQAGVFQFVLETKPVDTGLVKIDAGALKQGLAGSGKIALYGIYFDTGRAELKPESAPQLEEMAKLLRQNAKLRVFVVGHTDNQGGFDANLALSQKRAEALVATLVREFGIDAKRLQARGVANLAPLQTNADEAGRAKNRRVELVEQ
ncbi:DUF4892 domain-containing protein [Chitinimonas arctica]|uniref:DUF4892 domain-containing protein n=1 Tax=Chitinimonas arctica TaxID=2594795 RepID=A0A516SCR3_9NEIS|nr:OmpA family protein [Chitinimonas arctica]QDQ25931.1 DUF4892 domain-containing protein [Chitinimonas arctica]